MNITKNLFDRFTAFVGLVALSPLMLLIALLVRLQMGTPVLYVSDRVGQHGRIFRMVKFRSMDSGADRQKEGSVTTRNDPRVTRLGAFLRRFKLDELPELWCVLRGDMSLVGPRPDVPGYADNLTGEAREILKLKPGITGPATLKYANEEVLLASADDPVRCNDEVIFPDKVRLNLEYLRNWSFARDIAILFRTVFRGNY